MVHVAVQQGGVQGRTFIWDSTDTVSWGLAVMREKQPVLCPYRPMFLAYDWEQPSWWPSAKKVRIA